MDDETRAAINCVASSMDNVATALTSNAEAGTEAFDKLTDILFDGFASVAKKIDELDSNPALTKQQFIQEASMRLLTEPGSSMAPEKAAKWARELWFATRNVR